MSGAAPFGWLGDAMSGGLDQEDAREAFEQNTKMQEEAAQRAREIARLFYDVFAFGRGPELLEFLRLQTIELDLMNVSGATIGERQFDLDPANWAYYRNGQNSVVRYSETMIRLAQVIENEEAQNV